MAAPPKLRQPGSAKSPPAPPPAWPRTDPGRLTWVALINWPLVMASGGLTAVVLLGLLTAVVSFTASGPRAGAGASPVPAAAQAPGLPAVAQARPEETVPGTDAEATTPAGEPVAPAPPPADEAPMPAGGAPAPAAPPPALPADEAVPPRTTVADGPRPWVFKRRDLLTAEELLGQLKSVPEVWLDYRTAQQLVRQAKRGAAAAPHRVPEALTSRDAFAGLPFRQGDDCQLAERPAWTLQKLGRQLHGRLDVLARIHKWDESSSGADSLDFGPERRFARVEAIPALMQLVPVEDEPVRRALVRLLARIEDPAADTALARLALFDLAPAVREAAVNALRFRPPESVRPVLLAGLRYPWPPVADHAAEALASLGDRGAIPQLQALLDEPPPQFIADSPGRAAKFRVRELVRINHLRNCLLCHALSTDKADPVRGRVPIPGEALPPAELYYDSTSESSRRFQTVRADVTYLRQDFSALQPMKNTGAWPTRQRHDFLVRERPAEPEDLVGYQGARAAYPQREAVLFALRELQNLPDRPGR